MSEMMEEICRMVCAFGAAPTLEEMPRRTLADKGIDGPTAAHCIEEMHVPLNYAYLTVTTGTSAFQNVTGVTHAELPERVKASKLVLERAGLKCGDKLIITYPPLVNVFSRQALDEYGLQWSFLVRSGRDALLAALYEERPAAVVGESSFLRAAIEDAVQLGIAEEMPRGMKLLAAGTPLDLALLPTAEDILGARVYDLYGCQEFGWITIDGNFVRTDITLAPIENQYGQIVQEVIVGGLPMGDAFPLGGHVLDEQGQLTTYRRERVAPEPEVIVRATSLTAEDTVERVARSILRMKSKVVRVGERLITGSERTVLELVTRTESGMVKRSITVEGPEQTKLFDDLVRAQLDYQQTGKSDPVWRKRS